MKKGIVYLAIICGFWACNSDGTLNEQKVNAAGDKLQKTVEKTADTIANKVGRLADSVKARKDTLR